MPSRSGNCAERVLTQLAMAPDKVALWSSVSGEFSFAQVCQKSAQFQKGFVAAGLQKGDSVLLLCLPGPEFYSALLALLAAGVTAVFLEPWMPQSHLNQALQHAGLKYVLADSFGTFWRLRSSQLRRLPVLRLSELMLSKATAADFEVVPVDPAHIATVTFTSGTTGLPKGIARSHAYLWELHELLEKYSGESQLTGPDLSVFPNLALFHLGTGRGSVLVPRNWSPKPLLQLANDRSELQPHSITCGPTFMKQMLDSNLIFESVRCINLGGALIDCELMQRVLESYPNAKVRMIYGGTEVEPVCVVDARESLERSRAQGNSHATFLGQPISELDTRIDSDGVLWVSGPNVCGEYLIGSEHDRLNKVYDENRRLWHSMGDRIQVDRDGFWFCGRSAQPLDDFLDEQSLYRELGHTRAFLHRTESNHLFLIGEDGFAALERAARSVVKAPVEVIAGRIIRDRRHRARIDRHRTWCTALRFARFGRYLKERSPIHVLMVLALGPLVSGWTFAKHLSLCVDQCLGRLNLFLMAVGLLLSIAFLVAARAMDEIKDSEKDKTAHPARPLPRGLLHPDELRSFLFALLSLMIIFGFVLLFVSYNVPGLLFLFATVYLWLMYKEFYVGKWLSNFPLLYALSHQIVVVPLYFFAIALFIEPSKFEKMLPNFTAIVWLYVVANMFASMTYEFSRKLQPDKHKDAQTYRQIYGLRKASFLSLIFAAISFVSFGVLSIYVGDIAGTSGSLFQFVLAVFHVFLILLLTMHAFRDGLHKLIEALSALLFIATAWSLLFFFW